MLAFRRSTTSTMLHPRSLRQQRSTSRRWSARVQVQQRHSRSSFSSRHTLSTSPSRSSYHYHRSTSPACLGMSLLHRPLRSYLWASRPCPLTIRRHGSPQHRLLASRPWRLTTVNTPHHSPHLRQCSTSRPSVATLRLRAMFLHPP